jgi:acetyl-CoA carboxylase biotin carboxyl carrier protein
MPLSEADVREILRLIDASDVDELRVETEAFSLYVRLGETDTGEDKPPPAVDDRAADGAVTISAPMIGTFYRAEAPGAAPYVEVGTRVEPDTVVCLIEVMKMMNPIPAGVGGTIVEVCAANADPVEFGTPLFQVRPGP